MKARYRYRFYPTRQQITDLSRLFGCARWVWNDALSFCQQSEKLPTYNQLSTRLTQLKRNEETSWLKKVSSVALQQSLKDLATSYKNFFDSIKGKRKGKKVGKPRFKKRCNKQSVRLMDNAFTVKDGVVSLAKIGEIKVIWSRPLPSIPSSCTVIKDAANRYFVSFVVEIEPVQLTGGGSIGLDLGVIDFVTTSAGEKIKAPKPLRQYLNKLKREQRKLAKKQKGSKRREKQRLKVAKIHAKVKDIRDDFLHKLSTKIISENQTIVLEDLNTSGLMKNRKLSRAISDLGWRSFRTMLEAKAVMYGRDFRVIDRWEPTSQKCSYCGFKGGRKELSVREWTCLNCGTTHDRDINAAVNILVAGGQSETLNGHGEDVRLDLNPANLKEVSTRQIPKQLSFLDILFG